MNRNRNIRPLHVALVMLALALLVPAAALAAPAPLRGSPDLKAPAPVTAIQMGKLGVHVIDARAGAGMQPTRATILVLNGRAQVVAKGETNADGYWATLLPVGTYKVIVKLSPYLEYRLMAAIYSGQTTTLNAVFGNTQINF